MDSLPSEIVEYILASPQLNFKDILNFEETSQHFHKFVRGSSYIWRKKYQQKYPQFMQIFDSSFNNWYDEIVYIQDLRCRTHKLLASMSHKFYRRNQLSDGDLEDWMVLMSESPQVYHYLVFDLVNIINDTSCIDSIDVVPIDVPGNGTLQFYAIRVLRFIRQQFCTVLWEEYFDLSLNEQLLEKGATIIAQWCQPASVFEWQDITNQLDQLADEVISEVQHRFPDHPLLKVSKDVLFKWKMLNLEDNQWNINECKQIMSCIMIVVFDRNNFGGCYLAYYAPENSYIDQVLKNRQGLPITLSIIFESIARRVGLNCKPYPFPSHFLLQFTEGKIGENGTTYYIDVFNKGNRIKKGSCPNNRSGSTLNPHGNIVIATPNEVMERMANNLEVSSRRVKSSDFTNLRSALELIYAINPQDIQVIISLAHFYMMNGIVTKPLESFLLSDKFERKNSEQCMRIIQMLRDYDLHHRHNFSEQNKQIGPKVRSKDLLYAVGMIMNHVETNCQCIIYDWDTTCMVTFIGQQQVGTNLKYGLNQPFYKVLLVDGSHWYTPQENLTLSTVVIPGIMPEEVNKHFSHFYQTHFVPNAEKEEQYPEDAAVRHYFHQHHRIQRLSLFIKEGSLAAIN